MANITKRVSKSGEISYLVRFFVDEKQISKTWKPEKKMSEPSMKKAVEKWAAIYEDQLRRGLVSVDSSTRFADYAARWMEASQLAPTTRARYDDLLKRINVEIGNIRLDRLQAHHLEAFYQKLRESGAKDKGRYAVSNGLKALLEKRKLSKDAVGKMANISPSTVGTACSGKHISLTKANQIAEALSVPVNSIFKIKETTDGLAEKTILHHHRLISAILAKAKRERIVPFNVASEHATAPKVPQHEAVYLTDEQAQEIVRLLIAEEDIRVATALFILLYSGVRRGELCGLSWCDIDEGKGMLNIVRASQYQRRKGITEVPTKNRSSKRSIKVPPIVIQVLSTYRIWWLEQQLKHGDIWQGKAERLFIQADGKPINPDTINYWLEKFREKHSLPYFTPHTCRHTFASLQISAGVDIRTLQARTGHSQASTLLNIYSHAIKSAAEAATDALDDKLTPQEYRHA